MSWQIKNYWFIKLVVLYSVQDDVMVAILKISDNQLYNIDQFLVLIHKTSALTVLFEMTITTHILLYYNSNIEQR